LVDYFLHVGYAFDWAYADAVVHWNYDGAVVFSEDSF
jgi:hypothetical protein